MLFLLPYVRTAVAQKPEKSGANAVLYKIGQMKDDTNKVNTYFLEENNAIYQDEKALEIYSDQGNWQKH